MQAIRGQDDLALMYLERAMDEGWRQHWRPGVEPCFAGLLDNPQFVAMMDNLSSRMDLMREQIAFDAAFDSGWRLQT